MRLLYSIVFSAGLLLAAPTVVSAQPPERDAYKAVEGWAQAVSRCAKGCDPGEIAALANEISTKFYTPDGYEGFNAILLPTASNQLKQGQSAIRDYFRDDFLTLRPEAILRDYKTIPVVVGHAYLFVGFYDFKLTTCRLLHARYSFLMIKVSELSDSWRIAHQHSSKLPNNPCP